MEREVWEENYKQLAGEIKEAGFPERVLADLRREMEQQKRDDLMIFYDTEVEGRMAKVNLMEGRSIYREPAFDPARHGYWVSLATGGRFAGIRLLEYDRNDFGVEPA